MNAKLKKITFILFLAALLVSSCSFIWPKSPDQDSPLDMANPASLYCEEQGGRLEIRQSKDGSQAGYCIFPDGSECEEWAYFRDECEPGNEMHVTTLEDALGISEETNFEPFSMQLYGIYGSVVSSDVEIPASSMLLVNQTDLPTIYITGETGDIESQILAMRNQSEPNKNANFWGRLDCPTQDDCLLTVTDMRIDGPGEMPLPDQIDGWEGVIYAGPPEPGSGGDDYFALLGRLPLQFGIDGADDNLRSQLESLRDSGQAVRITGLLYAARPDWNGTQLVVTSIELIDTDPADIPPAPGW